MKLLREKREGTLSSALTQTLLGMLICFSLFTLAAFAADPSWWTSPGTGSQPAVMAEQIVTNDGIVSTNYITNQYAVVVQGQLKQFTARAVDELNVYLPGGASTNLNNLVHGWAQDYAISNYASTNNPYAPYKPSDFAAMTVGQLKTIANMVYGRFSAAGYTNLAPSWLPQNTNSDSNVAVIGQLKEMFDFDFALSGANNFIAHPGGSGVINLLWSSPSTTNTAPWIVEEQNTNGTWTFLASLPSTTNSYSVSGLTNGQSYNFQVFASGTNKVSVVASASATPSSVPQSGLVVWLEADAGLSQSSGAVTSWADQSTNGNNASPSSTPPTAITDENGNPAVHFNGAGSNFLSITDNSTLDPNTFTILAVAKDYGPGNSQFLVCRPYRTAPSGPPDYGGWTSPFMSYGAVLSQNTTTYQAGWVTPVGGTYTDNGNTNTYDPTQPHQFSWSYDGTNQVAHTDGNLASTVTTSGNIDYSGGAANLTIGVHSSTDLRPAYDEALNADVYEILVYNRALSSAELAQAETYLADKYDLALTLPAPTISPNGGTASSSIAVTLSAAPLLAVVRYTLDGTNPTADSSIYTGTITLTESRPITAALFLNDQQVSSDVSAEFHVGETGTTTGISDAWQVEYFGALLSSLGLSASTVGPNGLTYLQDYYYGYNPTVLSSNGDGLSDLINEQLGYSATNTDINGYGLSNAQQLALGLDPFDAGINPSLPTGNPSTYPVITLNIPTNATPIP